MKRIVGLWGLSIVILLSACNMAEEKEITIQKDAGKYLNEENSSTVIQQSENIHFLMTQEVSFDSKIVKTDVTETELLLDAFKKNCIVECDALSSQGSAEYYILLRDEEQIPICLIEVWGNYICVDREKYYYLGEGELLETIEELFLTSEELPKISPEEILLSCPMVDSDKLGKQYIVTYRDCPAVRIEEGYENISWGTNVSEEKYYYENIIFCEGFYFDAESNGSYAIAQSRIYYNEDGSVYDSFYKQLYLYDCFTGELIHHQ